jgi:hypothetical protein
MTNTQEPFSRRKPSLIIEDATNNTLWSIKAPKWLITTKITAKVQSQANSKLLSSHSINLNRTVGVAERLGTGVIIVF